jgi:polar amino acid transport system substrate-binding protein
MGSRRLLVGLAAVALALSACGGDDDDNAAATTAAGAATTPAGSAAGGTVDCKPVKSGVLTVVTSLPGPNFWGTTKAETDPDQIHSGIEYDLATDIAAKCGLKMEFRNENFDTIVAGQVDPSSYDIALSQVTITPERAKVVDFSPAYFKADQGFLVKKGTTIKTWDEVRKMRLGVQASTTAEEFLNTGATKVDGVKSFPDLATAYAALTAGTIDSVVIDTPINLGQAAQSNGALEVVGQFKTGDEYGAIYGKGNGKKEVFDPIIKGLVDDGTVTELIKKYLGGDPSTVPFIEVPGATGATTTPTT